MSSARESGKKKNELKLRDDISLLLSGEYRTPDAQFVSITRVELAPDNSVALVFWDSFDENKFEKIRLSLEEVGPKIQSHMARTLRWKKFPQFKFIQDLQYHEEKKIEDILSAEETAGKTF